MLIVAKLKSGTSFGELSLLTNSKCSATITTRTQTHLATLSKEDYLSMLKKYDEDQLDCRKKVITILPMFKSLTKNALIKLAYFFTETTFKRK